VCKLEVISLAYKIMKEALFKKPAFFVWLFLVAFAPLGIVKVLAYEPQPTHYSLAQKSAELFKQAYGNLLAEEIQWISEGATNEDMPPRWINHFFDPTTGLGWQGERLGDISPATVRLLSGLGLSSESAVSAKDWAQNQLLQSRYQNYQGNRTFEKAIYDYVSGDRKEAYKSLGHILHLIEDMAVPAHTRQDTHVDGLAGDPGEPYEKWAKENTDLSYLNNLDLRQENFSCVNLDDCFIKLAKYSNENFFSEDTINDVKYGKIIADRKKIEGLFEIYYKSDLFSNEYILAARDLKSDKILINQSFVHLSYWRLLSKQAVLAGAEVIRIFQQEVAKAQKDESLLQEPPKVSGLMKLATGLGGIMAGRDPMPIFSPYGEAIKIWEAGQAFLGSIGSLANSASSWLSFLSGVFGSTPQQIGPIGPIRPIGPIGQMAEESGSVSPMPLLNYNFPQPSLIIETIEKPEVVLPQNSVETILDDEEGPEISEEIFNYEITQIVEKVFSPIIPLQFPQSVPNLVPILSNEPDEPVVADYSDDPVSSSSPVILPETSLFLTDYSLTFRQFTVNWNSSSSGVVSYDVEYKIGSSSGDIWQTWETATTSTSKIFEVPQDAKIYYLRARAKNADGATSGWEETSAAINFYPIVVNEIAWAGTGTSTAADEWLELYNKTDKTIDLSGWSVVEATGTTTTIVNLKNNIGPGSYYLIERGDDNTISDISANLTGSWGASGLSNSGEKIRLVDGAGYVVDDMNFVSGWPAGSGSPNYLSMERVNPYLGADVPGNWKSNSTSTRNGLNAKGQFINGTPKSQNSVFNLEFFYLYPATNTTATSTFLQWTQSSLPNLKDYRIIRAFNSAFATSTIVDSVAAVNFFDDSLESESGYYYKINACDNSDRCVSSNIVSATTTEFVFSWADPKIVSGNSTTSDSMLADILLDNEARPVVSFYTSWNSAGGMMSSINILRNAADGSWTEPQSVSEDLSPNGSPAQILNKNGGLEVLFSAEPRERLPGAPESRDIFNAEQRDGLWQAPQNISLTGWRNFNPAGVVDETGITHVVWQGMSATSSGISIFYRAIAPDGSPTGEIQQIASSSSGLLPNIAIDQDGVLFAVWFNCSSGDSCYNIYYSLNQRDGLGWSEGKNIFNFGRGWAQGNRPPLLVNGNGKFSIAWEWLINEIRLIEFDGVATSSIQKFFYTRSNDISSPQIVLNNAGKQYLFFDGLTTNGKRGIYFTYQKDNGQWRTIKKAFEFDYFVKRPRAVIDANNVLHLIWHGGSGNWKIYYSSAQIE